MSEPLLWAKDACIASPGGGTLLESLNLSLEGPHIAWVGDVSGLVLWLRGEAQLVAGQLSLAGLGRGEALGSGAVGLVLGDPARPRGWTALRYLERRAELWGLPKGQIRPRAQEQAKLWGLQEMLTKKLSGLRSCEWRALQLLAVVLAGSNLIVLEAPLDGLEVVEQGWLAELIHAVRERHSTLLSIPHLTPVGLERALADSASEIVMAHGYRAAVAGPLGGADGGADGAGKHSQYRVVIMSGATEFVGVLNELGGRAQPSPVGAGPVDLVVTVPSPGETAPILEAAFKSKASLLSVVPLASEAS